MGDLNTYSFYRVLSTRSKLVFTEGPGKAGTWKLVTRAEDFSTVEEALQVRDYYRREASPGETAYVYPMYYGEEITS